ncbi:LysR family transcriptional regulator [Arthrobacter crystallopoietes BAB-32]|uniref:LysR family transcriptional regulator n=1 Tax=Arthrobacter crystallopoietes BAB-32 TaxID=1246476 RepID=N1UXQ1_9MICC|nr:LysR family transcriptional regulator [Arthrobacter crystallopoietes]EMY33800.1 LysR family transcriptional regulator [Arthrobacter crystallopoietes BAB-32]
MDLNLLRTFISVYETGSLTSTARAMFVTQPSVSHAVARLRQELADELFVRGGGRMEPTPVARSLYPEFKEAVARIDAAVDSTKSFDPATSARRFRLCLSDLGELGFLPQILHRVSDVAPLVEIEVVPMEISLLAEWLAKGTVDAAIASSPLEADFGSTLLKTEKYVCLLREDFRLRGQEMTLEEFTAAGHAIVARSTGHLLAENTIEELGIVRRSAVVVHHFAVLPHIVSECNLLAVVPESMARGWLEQWPLKVAELPFAVPPLDVMLHRGAVGRQSPALQWFHRTLLEALLP